MWSYLHCQSMKTAHCPFENCTQFAPGTTGTAARYSCPAAHHDPRCGCGWRGRSSSWDLQAARSCVVAPGKSKNAKSVGHGLARSSHEPHQSTANCKLQTPQASLSVFCMRYACEGCEERRFHASFGAPNRNGTPGASSTASMIFDDHQAGSADAGCPSPVR